MKLSSRWGRAIVNTTGVPRHTDDQDRSHHRAVEDENDPFVREQIAG